jgi:hypothetical protein
MMINETTKTLYRKHSKGKYLQIASQLYLTHVNNVSAEDIVDSGFSPVRNGAK